MEEDGWTRDLASLACIGGRSTLGFELPQNIQWAAPLASLSSCPNCIILGIALAQYLEVIKCSNSRTGCGACPY
jgi:hypothetical protein